MNRDVETNTNKLLKLSNEIMELHKASEIIIDIYNKHIGLRPILSEVRDITTRIKIKIADHILEKQ